MPGCRLVAGDRRPLAGRDAEGVACPDGADADPGPALKGTLRPYQKAGVHWMHLLSGLGLGACLADDMGLGKTIQVLSLLLAQRRTGEERCSQACWWGRRRCSPTGRRKSSGSRPA